MTSQGSTAPLSFIAPLPRAGPAASRNDRQETALRICPSLRLTFTQRIRVYTKRYGDGRRTRLDAPRLTGPDRLTAPAACPGRPATASSAPASGPDAGRPDPCGRRPRTRRPASSTASRSGPDWTGQSAMSGSSYAVSHTAQVWVASRDVRQVLRASPGPFTGFGPGQVVLALRRPGDQRAEDQGESGRDEGREGLRVPAEEPEEGEDRDGRGDRPSHRSRPGSRRTDTPA